jgi:hypothetical protein
MNLKSILPKSEYEDLKRKYEELEEKYSKIQLEMIKKDKELEKIKNENEKFKKKNNNDTSSDYPWPKEFSEKWVNFVQNLIMDCFENCCDNNYLLTKIVNCTLKVVYNVATIYIKEKIIDLYKCLGINNPNEDEIIFFFEKFKILIFQVYYKTLFHFNDEIFSSIISKIKTEIDELNKEQNLFKFEEIEQINKDLESTEISYLFKELFLICIYMNIHDPPLTFDFKYEINYFFYSKNDYIIIDGFEKENAVCALILYPPLFKSNCFYRELKPGIKIIDNPTNEMIERCKYNQFLNEKSKSSKIMSVKKQDIEILEDKKELIEKIIKTPENTYNSQGFFINTTNAMITNRSIIPTSASKIIKKCDIQKKKKIGKYQNFLFKGLEKKINKNLKKNKLKTSLDNFINKTSQKNIMKNSSLSDSEQERSKKENKRESSRSNLTKLQKQIKNTNLSRNNITVDFESHSRRYNISDNLIRKMFTEFSSPRSLKEKLAFFKKLSFEKRRTYSMNLPYKNKSKKFNTINLANKSYKTNNLTHIIQSKSTFPKKLNKKKQVSDLFQLGIDTNLDIFGNKNNFNSPMLRNNSQKSKITKGCFQEKKLKNNVFTSSNTSLSKHISNFNSISESLSYKNINTNTINNLFNHKKKKMLSQTQPLKFIGDYITLNLESTNIKTKDIDESNSGLISTGNNFRNKNVLCKLRNKSIKKKNNYVLGKKVDVLNYEFSINNIKKARFNSPIQRKNELNNANGKIKNSNLGNCNLSKISEIKTYFVQFQKEKEKSDKK